MLCGARRTDVDERDTEEGDGSDVRASAVLAAREGLAREERVEDILSKGTAETVRDLIGWSSDAEFKSGREERAHFEGIENDDELDAVLPEKPAG